MKVLDSKFSYIHYVMPIKNYGTVYNSAAVHWGERGTILNSQFLIPIQEAEDENYRY